MSDKKKSEPGCLALTLGLFSLAASIPVRAWAVTHCWGWFVCPLGAPAIGMAEALGLSLTFGLIRGGYARQDDKGEEPDASDIVFRWIGRFLVAPLIIVLIAWIVHTWFR